LNNNTESDILNLDLPDVPHTIQKNNNKSATTNFQTQTYDLDLPSVPTFSPLNTTTVRKEEDSLFDELNQRLLGLKPQSSGTTGNDFVFPTTPSQPFGKYSNDDQDLDLPSVPQFPPTTTPTLGNDLDMDLPTPPLGFTRSVVAYSYKPDLLNPTKKDDNPDEDELFSRFSKLRK